MKRIKKLLALFLSFAMVVSVLSGTGLQMQAASSSTVVYFNNKTSDWSNVYAYVWGSGLTTKAIKGKKVADHIYKMEIPGSYSKILFKNTSGTSNWDKKTANTTIPTDGKNCFKTKSAANKSDGTWSTYIEETATPKATSAVEDKSTTVTFYYDNNKTNWSTVHAYVWGGDTTTTVQGTSVGNNVYSFTISSNYQNVLFKNTSGTSSWDKQTADAGAPQSGKIFTPSSSANKTGGTWNTYTTATPVNYITFNYDNSKTNWSNVYVYAWVEGDSSVAPVIVKSIACVNNVYSFRVADTYKDILFKNIDSTSSWDQQTADTTMPSTYGYTFVTYSGANKTGGYWTTTPVTTAPVTTAPVTTPPTNTITFYYDNSKTNWSSVHVYAWGGATTQTFVGTSVGNHVYSFTISSNYQNVLFKNTSGTSSWDKQTADAGAPQSGKIFTPSSSSNKTGGSWNTYTTPIPVTYKTVSYDNSKTNWSNVYAYVWTEGDSSVIPVVLGKTAVSGNTYSFKVASTYKNILFKNTNGTTNWDQQTADAVVPTSDGYTFVPYSGNNKTDGYWKESAVTPTPEVVRRALCIADSTETNGNTAEARARHWRDTKAMAKTFENFTFDGQSMDTIGCYSDLTLAQITDKIRTTFAGTTENDVSYVYLNCHGGPTGTIAIGTDGSLDGQKLRNLLDQYVKGEVVVILYCCYAGNVIGEDIEDVDIASQFLASFTDVSAESGELASKRFHVLCSSSMKEVTYSYTYGVATKYETEGLGWDEINEKIIDLKADANEDKKVTMEELYNYTYPLVLSHFSNQHMVVYPANDNFIVGGRY